jgi:hypothetical protein
MNDTPKSPRVRPWLRRAAIAACILLLPFAVHSGWEYVEMRRLVREVEAIRAKGEPVTARDAGWGYFGTSEEHRQASRQYLAAAVLVLDLGRPPALVESHEWIHGGVPLKRSVGEIASDLQALTEAHADTLKLIDGANGLDFKGFHPGSDYSYRRSSLASASTVLSARTLGLAFAGRGDEAVQAALASLKFRRVEQDSRWYSLMNPTDHETPAVLSLSAPSDGALQMLQRALEAEEARVDPVRDMLGRRATMLEAVWREVYGPEPNAPRAYTFRALPLAHLVMRPWVTHQLVAGLRASAEVIAAARQPWPAKAQAVTSVQERQARSQGVRYGIPAFSVPALGGIDADRLIRDRASRIAVAIARYRLAHAGAVPGRLDDLVPQFLAAVPADPLSEAPMMFLSEPGAYTIYSVGMDGKDDGGDLASELKQAIERGRPRIIRGKDKGVRVLVR